MPNTRKVEQLRETQQARDSLNAEAWCLSASSHMLETEMPRSEHDCVPCPHVFQFDLADAVRSLDLAAALATALL